MKKLAMVLVLVMVFGIGTAVAEEERRPGPPGNEQFIYALATVNDLELIRQRGCLADLDLFYEELLFTGIEAWAPMQICDALWVSGIVQGEVAVKLAYRFTPELRVRIVRMALFDLDQIED